MGKVICKASHRYKKNIEKRKSVFLKKLAGFASYLAYVSGDSPVSGRFLLGHHCWATRYLLCLFLSFIVMPNMDKIFCSKWLSHRQVVFGTKCNKLMVFDVNTRQVDHIPSLASSENSSPPEAECGIHAIEINPSKTLLATGGK